MPKRKKERRFFGLFPGRSNSFAPPTRTDDTSSVNAAVLAGIIVSDTGQSDDDRERTVDSGYDHPASAPLNPASYDRSPSHYDYGGGSGYDGGGSYGGYDSGGSSDGGGGGGGD